jgi:diguanylate cyclase
MSDQDYTALNLREPGRHADPGGLGRFLDKLLVLVRDLLASLEDPRAVAVSAQFEACRVALVEAANIDDLADLMAACLVSGRQLIVEQQAHHAERARDITSLFNAVRDVMASVGNEMTSIQTGLTQSTDRFEAIGRLTDLRQMRQMLVAEVQALRQLTTERRAVWHRTSRALQNRIAGLERQLVVSEAEAATDALTGIFNRRGFDRTVQEWIRDGSSTFALAIVDIDDFKAVNDQHGHDAGDQVLKALAQTLMQSVRQGDVVARIGGDEFAILSSGLTLIQVERRMKTVLQQLTKPLPDLPLPDPKTLPAASCGVTEFAAGDTVATLCKRADEALYAAKRQGKNRVAAKAAPFLRDLK